MRSHLLLFCFKHPNRDDDSVPIRKRCATMTTWLPSISILFLLWSRLRLMGNCGPARKFVVALECKVHQLLGPLEPGLVKCNSLYSSAVQLMMESICLFVLLTSISKCLYSSVEIYKWSRWAGGFLFLKKDSARSTVFCCTLVHCRKNRRFRHFKRFGLVHDFNAIIAVNQSVQNI